MNDDDDRTQIGRIERICWIKKLGVLGENPSPAYVGCRGFGRKPKSCISSGNSNEKPESFSSSLFHPPDKPAFWGSPYSFQPLDHMSI
jgi:hypothetical protein